MSENEEKTENTEDSHSQSDKFLQIVRERILEAELYGIAEACKIILGMACNLKISEHKRLENIIRYCRLSTSYISKGTKEDENG